MIQLITLKFIHSVFIFSNNLTIITINENDETEKTTRRIVRKKADWWKKWHVNNDFLIVCHTHKITFQTA